MVGIDDGGLAKARGNGGAGNVLPEAGQVCGKFQGIMASGKGREMYFGSARVIADLNDPQRSGKGEGVGVTSTDRDNVTQAERHIGLAQVVLSPTNDGSVHWCPN